MMQQSYTKRLCLLLLCSFGMAYANVADPEDLDTAVLRGHHKEKDTEARKLSGIIRLFIDDETDSFLPQVIQGKGFCLKEPEAEELDATQNYTDMGLSLIFPPIGACNQSLQVGPFAVRQVRTSGRIQFACSCKSTPVVLTSIRADERAAFEQLGYLGDKVLLNSIAVQIRDVDPTGFTFDIIVIMSGSNTFVINDALDLLLPEIGMHFVAFCCS